MNPSVLSLILLTAAGILVPLACVILGIVLASRKHRAWAALAVGGFLLMAAEVFTVLRLFF